MNRRHFLKCAGMGVSAWAGFGISDLLSARTAQKPNILFILIDDMGYADPSCCGGTGLQTPNMDRLARQGTRFTQFYVNSPVCSPSRVAVTTGQYPARWRIFSYLDSRKENRRRNMADFLAPQAQIGRAHV